MKIPAFVGGSYTAASNAIADEECINLYAEKVETAGAQTNLIYRSSPGLLTFSAGEDGPVRAQWNTGTRYFAIIADTLYEIASDGTRTARGYVTSDGFAAQMLSSSIELFIVSAGHAYCYTLATDTLTEVTSLLAGTPIQAGYGDGYFAVMFFESNKFQTSDIFDGTVWPPLQVNEVSVFPENLVTIEVNHRELLVFGMYHMQPYQNTGSDSIYDPIPGTLVETGCAATFGINRIDNTVFWINQDERGGRVAARANGYTPQRISTHAVELTLASVDDISTLVTYSYQEQGHLFWVLYIPGTDFTWVYDVSTNLWAKRYQWLQESATSVPHYSWNHCYAFGKHLVGDWATGNIYEMSDSNLDDNGVNIRRVRRSPTMVNEMKWLFFSQIVLDFATGLGPQPPFTDGDGDDRQPQAILRWSDDRGSTWSNDHILDCGFAGQYTKRVMLWRLGRSRYRVWEVVVTDPIPWTLIDAYVEVTA